MRTTYPYLKRFKSNWACRELVIGVPQNRRKSENAKSKGVGTKKAERTSKRTGFKPRSKVTEDSDLGAAASSNNASEDQAEDQTENQTEN